jgi:site-specific recombinase XerD
MTGKSKEAGSINRTLGKLEQQIRDHYSRMALEDAYVTAESVKNALCGIGAKATHLLQLFREHNEEFKLRVGVNRVRETYEQYVHSYRVLEKFLQLRYNMNDIALIELDYRFIDTYDFYLRVDKKMKPNSVLNHIIPLQKMIRRAIAQNTLKRNPFASYVSEKPLKQRRHLTMEEFQRLLNTSIMEKNLNKTRDMFLFSCFTGLSFADIHNLSEHHVTTDEQGVKWIKINRRKTGSECNIRLLKQANAIMEKYGNERTDDKIFRMITLNNMGNHLKVIAKKCGIETNLTFHMGRHTFASTITF